ncbi:hypothetical protein BpHYR1_017714 [Brachionus plicatilis]|uniref:Uncharacterized protein n=1 Tax=Brachionus plicatilis TaxID=10195 RepID=A0A3M7PKA5_BRAPC|nr:hypothetical protein BpHYR1_017714 [Brachionus plicatilis]
MILPPTSCIMRLLHGKNFSQANNISMPCQKPQLLNQVSFPSYIECSTDYLRNLISQNPLTQLDMQNQFVGADRSE